MKEKYILRDWKIRYYKEVGFLHMQLQIWDILIEFHQMTFISDSLTMYLDWPGTHRDPPDSASVILVLCGKAKVEQATGKQEQDHKGTRGTEDSKALL